MDFELSLTIGVGIAIGVCILWGLNTLLAVPKAIKHARHHRRMQSILDEAMQDVVNIMERNRHDKSREGLKPNPTVRKRKARPTSKVTNSKVRSGTKAKSTKTSNKSR